MYTNTCTSNIIVRHAVPEDAAAIAYVNVVSRKHAYGHIHTELDNTFMQQCYEYLWRRALVAKRYLTWVACDGDGVLGFIAAKLDDKDNKDDRVEVDMFFIDPQAQRQGIGAKLIRALENELAGTISKLSLSVFSNSSALGFYQAMGFQHVGEGDVWRGVPQSRMEKVL